MIAVPRHFAVILAIFAIAAIILVGVITLIVVLTKKQNKKRAQAQALMLSMYDGKSAPICGNCGNRMTDGSAFCNKCGAQVEPDK